MTVVALPRVHYRRSFEPACGAGYLTRLLADRSDEHVAMDRHPRAVAATARRCADQPTVVTSLGTIPDDWPSGSFDLVVLSEVLYYLDAAALEQVLALVADSLVVGGDLVAVHYRPVVEAHVQTGDEIHERLASCVSWEAITSTVDSDFRLDAFRR